MPDPSVSIIVPTYNRVEQLKLCIGALLLLDYPSFEIIVVDDGSTDDTASYVRSLGERVIGVTIAHGGRSAARNAGIRAARGEIIAFTDDDCLVDLQWLRNLLVPFCDTRVVGVSGAVIYVGEEYVAARGERVVENRQACWPMTANVAYRADVLRQIGGFDETFERYEDKELALRVWMHGRVVPVPEAKVYHQKTEGGTWPDFSFAHSSSAWVRMKHMHDLRVDKNNPAPFLFGCILLPRKYIGLGWRSAALPILLLWLRSESRRERAQYELRMWYFLLLERLAIWKEAIHQKTFVV